MTDQLSNDLASLRLDRQEPRASRAGAWIRGLGVLAGAAAAVFGANAAWPTIEARLFATEVDIGTVCTLSAGTSTTPALCH